jgi:hypothetical protein
MMSQLLCCHEVSAEADAAGVQSARDAASTGSPDRY